MEGTEISRHVNSSYKITTWRKHHRYRNNREGAPRRSYLIVRTEGGRRRLLSQHAGGRITPVTNIVSGCRCRRGFCCCRRSRRRSRCSRSRSRCRAI